MKTGLYRLIALWSFWIGRNIKCRSFKHTNWLCFSLTTRNQEFMGGSDTDCKFKTSLNTLYNQSTEDFTCSAVQSSSIKVLASLRSLFWFHCLVQPQYSYQCLLQQWAGFCSLYSQSLYWTLQTELTLGVQHRCVIMIFCSDSQNEAVNETHVKIPRDKEWSPEQSIFARFTLLFLQNTHHSQGQDCASGKDKDLLEY